MFENLPEVDVGHRNIKGFEFRMTCMACPEQYDVFLGEELVGYVRLRWGCIRAEFPDVWRELVYVHEFNDPFMGCFDNEKQRMKHLKRIAKRLKEYVKCEHPQKNENKD